jgi:hypothetical protein
MKSSPPQTERERDAEVSAERERVEFTLSALLLAPAAVNIHLGSFN